MIKKFFLVTACLLGASVTSHAMLQQNDILEQAQNPKYKACDELAYRLVKTIPGYLRPAIENFDGVGFLSFDGNVNWGCFFRTNDTLVESQKQKMSGYLSRTINAVTSFSGNEKDSLYTSLNQFFLALFEPIKTLEGQLDSLVGNCTDPNVLNEIYLKSREFDNKYNYDNLNLGDLSKDDLLKNYILKIIKVDNQVTAQKNTARYSETLVSEIATEVNKQITDYITSLINSLPATFNDDANWDRFKVHETPSCFIAAYDHKDPKVKVCVKTLLEDRFSFLISDIYPEILNDMNGFGSYVTKNFIDERCMLLETFLDIEVNEDLKKALSQLNITQKVASVQQVAVKKEEVIVEKKKPTLQKIALDFYSKKDLEEIQKSVQKKLQEEITKASIRFGNKEEAMAYEKASQTEYKNVKDLLTMLLSKKGIKFESKFNTLEDFKKEYVSKLTFGQKNGIQQSLDHMKNRYDATVLQGERLLELGNLYYSVKKFEDEKNVEIIDQIAPTLFTLIQDQLESQTTSCPAGITGRSFQTLYT